MDKKTYQIRYCFMGLFMMAILFPGKLSAQFEQKLSLNVSAGYFNTLGWNGHEENWEDHGPTLMPNFKGGPSISAGLQYNFSRHFSLEFQLAYSFAPGWYFDASPEGEDAYSYLYYEIYDEATEMVLATGENYMDMTHMFLGIAPRYYFTPGNRFNPFIVAGVNLSYLDVYFEDQQYENCQKLGRLDLYEPNEDLVDWFENQVGVSLMAGAGVEYTLNDSWGLFAMAAYHFVPLRDESFARGSFLIPYHDLSIRLGARFSFLKSKTL